MIPLVSNKACVTFSFNPKLIFEPAPEWRPNNAHLAPPPPGQGRDSRDPACLPPGTGAGTRQRDHWLAIGCAGLGPQCPLRAGRPIAVQNGVRPAAGPGPKSEAGRQSGQSLGDGGRRAQPEARIPRRCAVP